MLIGALLGAVLAVVASPAWAHDSLIGTDPAQDAVVDTLPDQLELTFSGVLMTDGGTEVSVLDASCTELAPADPVIDGTKLTQALDAAAPVEGVVTVLWRVVSSDGHPVSGEYTFSVGADASGTACDTTASAGAEDDDDSASFGWGEDGFDALPWVIGIGIGVVVVAGVVLALFFGRGPSKRHPRED